MSHGLIHSLILARVTSVESIARVLYPDPLDPRVDRAGRSDGHCPESAERAGRTGPNPGTDMAGSVAMPAVRR